MRQRTSAALAAVAGLLLAAGLCPAAVKPHPLVTENMVLQQGAKAPIWGTADPGEEVKATFQGKEYQTNAKDGKWQIDLLDLKAGGPFELKINGLTLKNVMVGEVWICSGQSNMEMSVASSADAAKIVAEANYPAIRLFTVPHTLANAPLSTVNGSWSVCSPTTVPGFSAVAYGFGRALHKSLDVPVGLIHTSWGGTEAEAWTSRPVLEADPLLKKRIDVYEGSVKKYFADLNGYADRLTEYADTVRKSAAAGKVPPPPPMAPAHPDSGPNNHPASLYNGMIAPLIPYAIKGAIWYQGESNAGRAYEYRTLFPAMIKNWRDDWKEGDFPFLFVQLAPFSAGDSAGVVWAELREAQLLTTKALKNTAMAVITDVGDEKDIHPKQKDVVGQRLELAAEALAYGKKVEYSGPVYKAMKVEGDNKVTLAFDHVGGGLVAKGGPLQGFTVAGEDQKFVRAEAEIQGNMVVVWSNEVSKPVAVRYGWSNFPVVNLFNKEGLPATPFRTDDFPLVTKPK